MKPDDNNPAADPLDVCKPAVRPGDGKSVMDDEARALLASYRSGDTEALTGLVEQYRRPLFGFIYHLTGGRGDPEGVFQETWIRAIRNLKNFRDDNLLGWLFRTARNLVIDQSRRDRFRAEMPGPLDSRGPDWTDRIEARELDPATVVAGRDLGERIQAAVARLPADQRDVFLMRMQADMTFREIAAALGIPLNTALGRMHYAVGKLREILKEEYASFREDGHR
jgi:RNA polymerase sigma-70 factor (ECF subfamily)